MNRIGRLLTTTLLGICFFALALGTPQDAHSAEVRVSRFWHNHQPIYWPEWNSTPQNERIQFAQDSINLKSSQYYDSTTAHPENDLNAIFSVQDRINAYQSGPRNSLASVYDGGYSMSYSGSLINNVDSLGNAGFSGYGSGWWDGNREATKWLTSGGSPKLDMVGFTYHHSLGPVLPKSVFRKELQIFQEAAYKAWDMVTIDNRSKGFFPTEMAFSQTMIEVLEEEGYEWAIVASHHLSRTIPNYTDHADPEGSFNIFSSPPNKADQINPSISDGWWFGTGNVGETAWNVAPFAYQLHKAKYVNPESGTESTIIMVPSDDIQSYKAGYSGWQKSLIDDNIAPYANDPARPCIVMPSTDGDNAWGGGSSSWEEDAPSMMNNGTYPGVAVQDFVNDYGGAADTVHVEDGAWIFPESDYGSPYFLKWVEPPANSGSAACVPNTQIDCETPGFTPKFYSWAAVMSGANWCETAEQIWKDLNVTNTVEAWKIQDPYNNLGDGESTDANIVERAWHIYLGGLDSGFQYYGGEGNDDEIKTSLATRRAVEILEDFMDANAASDRTPPTVFKPQRFPWNPGGYTFGWFNIIPGDGNALKKMESEFYIWTHAYDVNGITNIAVKVRMDNDGSNSTANNQNETYAGGNDVGSWVSVPMTMRELPVGASNLTAAANNSKISYFDEALSPEVADYYFAKINDAALSGFRGKLLDYYIESTDARGNTSKSDIQHVWVEDDGEGGSSVSFSSDPRDCAPLTVTYSAAGGDLEGVSPVVQQISLDGGTNWTAETMSGGSDIWSFTNAMSSNTTSAIVWFQNVAGTITDSNGGANWSTAIRDCNAAVFSNGVSINPAVPMAGQLVTITYDPSGRVLASATNVNIHYGYNNDNWTTPPGAAMAAEGANWIFSYPIPQAATSIVMVFNDGSLWDNNNSQNWTFAVDPYVPTVPDGVIITNPVVSTSTVAFVVSNRTLSGTAGTNVTGDLTWTNAGSGASGSLSLTDYWNQSVDLAVGDNRITVSGPIDGGTSASTVTIIREAYIPPVADGVVITTPSVGTVTVANAVSSYAVSGTAGTNLTAGLIWTNSAMAQGGGFVHASHWTQTVDLAVGDNTITVSGAVAGTGATTVTDAVDSAAAYGETWEDGSNLGSGFDAWSLYGSSNAGTFASSGRWGLWSHEGGNLSEAIRPFSTPLTTGQTFSVYMENGWIWESGGSIGVALRDSVGATLWELYFNGGDTFYNTPAGATDIGWTDAGLEVFFTVTDTNAFSVAVYPEGGSARQYSGTFEGAISDFRGWSSNNGTEDGQNSNRNFYLNDLRVTHPLDGSETYSIATVHIIRESDGAGPPIPPIVFESGTGFSFTVPDGYVLNRVEGADAVVGDIWNWATLVLGTDYTLDTGTLTILTTGSAEKRMIRIYLDPL